MYVHTWIHHVSHVGHWKDQKRELVKITLSLYKNVVSKIETYRMKKDSQRGFLFLSFGFLTTDKRSWRFNQMWESVTCEKVFYRLQNNKLPYSSRISWKTCSLSTPSRVYWETELSERYKVCKNGLPHINSVLPSSLSPFYFFFPITIKSQC